MGVRTSQEEGAIHPETRMSSVDGGIEWAKEKQQRGRWRSNQGGLWGSVQELESCLEGNGELLKDHTVAAESRLGGQPGEGPGGCSMILIWGRGPGA